MQAMLTLFRKELSDQFSSRRFIILLALVWLSGLVAMYVAGQTIRAAVEGSDTSFVFLKLFLASSGALPPFVAFVGFFAPLVGLALAFDAINRERSSGTLGLLLSQPIYRDAVMNGKFLAGLATIAFMMFSIVLIVSGLGLWLIGVPPTLEEVLRIIAYALVTVVYIGFWMALAMLFSVLLKRIATSALAGIAVWMFFLFFTAIIAGVAADRLAPVNEQDPESELRNIRVQAAIMRVSPSTLYEEAIATLLEPNIRTLGPLTTRDVQGMVPGPLPFTQSLLLVWPQVVTIVALMLVCFAASYVKFVRQEIRAP